MLVKVGKTQETFDTRGISTEVAKEFYRFVLYDAESEDCEVL